MSELPQQSGDGAAALPGVGATGSIPLLAPASGDARPDYLEQSALIADIAATTKGFGSSSSAPSFIGFDASSDLQSGGGNVPAAHSGDTPTLAATDVGGLATNSPPGNGEDQAISSATTVTGAGLKFVISFDSSVNSAPAGFTTAVLAAFQFYANQFTNPVTLFYNVGYGEIAGQPLGPGALGESLTAIFNVPYSTLTQDLSGIPATDPTNGSKTLQVSQAEAQILGIPGVPAATAGSPDGSIGFALNGVNGISFTFDPNNRAVSGLFDAIGAMEHEISEVMGRISRLGSNGTALPDFTPMDLFRFSAPGVRQLTTGNPSYFSIDNGVTNLGAWNNFTAGDTGDLGDWASTNPYTADSYNDDSEPGFADIVTARDITLMNELGYTSVASQPPPPPPQPPGPPTPVVNLDAMPPGDFNHGGASDTITLSTDGTLQIFSTTNGAIAQVFNIGKVGTELSFGAVGNFFGSNAASDFILRGPQGQTELFQINNDAIANVVQEGNIGPDFQIVSVGDYFQSGTDAFITRSVNTGAMELYQLNNGQITNAFSFGQIGTDQTIVGQGNFFNNGTEDMMVEQQGTGLLQLYQVLNGQIVAFSSLGAVGASEHIIGVGDFNGDGTTDALERSDSGALGILEIRAGQVVGFSSLGQVGLEFQPAGVGDFFGNGTDDFMMRSGQQIELYKVQNYQIVNATTYGVTGTNVQLAGAYFNQLV